MSKPPQHMQAFGESFGGQYIPYIGAFFSLRFLNAASLIFDDHCSADAILKTTLLSTPLKGIAIGNGWIDGRYQYPAYLEFAIRSGIITENSDVRPPFEPCRRVSRVLMVLQSFLSLPRKLGQP